MRRSLVLSLALVPVALFSGLGCSDSHGAGDNPLVAGLSIDQVALFQGLKSPLMLAGAATDSTVPVIAGRAGTLRVYVTPTAAFTPRIIDVHVELTSGGAALPALDVKQMVSAASNEADLASTINFDLPKETISSDLTYSVSLREASSGSQADGVSGARYPRTGEVALGASASGVIKITLVPVAFGADGSNRVPATGDADLALFRDRMLALYPVTEVQITVSAPYTWTSNVAADGTGWDELLNAIVNKRADDGADKDVYYYGLFKPAASFDSYCQQGCVLGLSPLAFDPMDEFARASIGVGFPGADAGSNDTFVHEVGHAHGRQHAPCQVQDPDRKYPYADGALGVWGYDAAKKELYDPSADRRDMMGYCDPVWISDYTYNALYTRVKLVNNLSADRRDVPSRWQSLIVRPSGVVRGAVATFQRPPMGSEKQIERIVDGRSERLSARYYPFDHLPGGLLYVPVGAEGTLDLSTLRVDGMRVK